MSTAITISEVRVRDVRYPLHGGAGADAVHRDPLYSYAVTELVTDRPGLVGTGLAFTLGPGNDLVCQAIEALAPPLLGRPIEELMADFGRVCHEIENHPHYRWLGPHKGVVHLALASLVNACWDLWAKARGVPLWRLLLDLTPEQLVATLDLSYLEDVLSRDAATALLHAAAPTRASREGVLRDGYPGYDTSVGWINYSDSQIRDNARRAVAEGFTAMKLKVGSSESARDIRRAHLIRDTIGDAARLMFDANQAWTLPQALRICLELSAVNPFWIEEPTHPDDVLAHQTLARAIAPVQIALGEHVPNRVLMKNFLQAGACGFLQADCVRVGGVSEFLAISLMAKRFGVPIVPHVGDMGQIHQHLVLANHVAIGHDVVFLEYIPHLREHFRHPAVVRDGVYRVPQEPGSSSDLV